MTIADHERITSLSFSTSVGWITLFEKSNKIISLEWGRVKLQAESYLLKAAKTEIIEYINKERKKFSIPLSPTGTNFQKSVWAIIENIPYGETRTYGDIANQINSAPRPIGGACSKNPIPIIIPCHRVIGTKNKLTGFSGGFGVQTKQSLIKLESQVKHTLNIIN